MIIELFYICLVVSEIEKINNLGDVCLVEIGVGGTYLRCLVISTGLGGEKMCVGGFKVLILKDQRKEESHQEETSLF